MEYDHLSTILPNALALVCLFSMPQSINLHGVCMIVTFLEYRWYRFGADSRFAPSQWETALLRNDVSHWLGARLESAMEFMVKCLNVYIFHQWAVLPLAGMGTENGMYSYEIHVYTGFKKNSETDSNISLVVIGTEGDSGVLKLTDGERKV